jgi:hypothetical protein
MQILFVPKNCTKNAKQSKKHTRDSPSNTAMTYLPASKEG